MKTRTDVLVVGVGAVGLTMAAELVRYGLSVRIIDKNTARTDRSKAIAVWPRTLELLDRMGRGVTKRFTEAGLKVNCLNISANGEQIAHVDLLAVETHYRIILLNPTGMKPREF